MADCPNFSVLAADVADRYDEIAGCLESVSDKEMDGTEKIALLRKASEAERQCARAITDMLNRLG